MYGYKGSLAGSYNMGIDVTGNISKCRWGRRQRGADGFLKTLRAFLKRKRAGSGVTQGSVPLTPQAFTSLHIMSSSTSYVIVEQDLQFLLPTLRYDTGSRIPAFKTLQCPLNCCLLQIHSVVGPSKSMGPGSASCHLRLWNDGRGTCKSIPTVWRRCMCTQATGILTVHMSHRCLLDLFLDHLSWMSFHIRKSHILAANFLYFTWHGPKPQ